MKKALPILILVLAVIIVVFVRTGIVNKGERDAGHMIAVVPEARAGVFWESVLLGASQACEGTDFRICRMEPPGAPRGQAPIVDDSHTHGLSGVVLGCLGERTLGAWVEETAALKVPCVVIGSRGQAYEQDHKGVCCVGPDEYISGLIAARRMAEILGNRGRIVVLSYLPESGPTTRREKGFVNAIAKDFEGIEIVDSECGDDTVEAASKAAENLLGRHPQVDGLFACNESTSLGALQALQRRQLPGKIKMVGFGVEKPLIDGLRAGEIDCLVVRNGYRIGYEAVRAVIAANRGEQPKRHIDVKAVPVTRANLDTPEIRRLLEAGSR